MVAPQKDRTQVLVTRQSKRSSTMYTWTDKTDKNLNPNKANMTAFKNLTWFREFNGEKKHNFQIKQPSDFRYISLAPPPISNFNLKMVPKNGANFVLNCAAIFKFCAVQHFAECWGGLRRRQPPPIANFDFKIVSKNCANFVLRCTVIFKFCAVSPPEVSLKEVLRASPSCELRLKNGTKKLC